jgi:hypothetical protein
MAMTDERDARMREVRRAHFLQWEAASRDTIDVKRIYIDITGDLAAGVLLSQIIYWYLPIHSGGPIRLSQAECGVELEGQWWLVKKRTEWWHECRLTDRQFDHYSAILIKKGFISTRVARFRGNPMLHIHLELERIIDAMELILDPGKTIS